MSNTSRRRLSRTAAAVAIPLLGLAAASHSLDWVPTTVAQALLMAAVVTAAIVAWACTPRTRRPVALPASPPQSALPVNRYAPEGLEAGPTPLALPVGPR